MTEGNNNRSFISQLEKWTDAVTRYFKVLIAVFFSAASLLYISQLVLRSFFNVYFLWLEPLIQYLFLISGLFGAAIAVRTDENIKIEIFRKYGNTRTIRIIKYTFACAVTFFIARIFMKHLIFEKSNMSTAAFQVKNWILDIPYIVIFGMSALYYFLNILFEFSKQRERPS
ncbi:TRAP transporter small permease [Spirochaetota bacterium]